MDETRFLKLNNESLIGGSIANFFYHPASVNCACPECGREANFVFSGCKVDQQFWTLTHARPCSGCGYLVKFFGNYTKGEVGSDRHSLQLYVLAQNSTYILKSDFSDHVAVPLDVSYRSAVDSFNAGNYPAAIVLGRRTLEGIFKFLLSEDKRGKSLSKLIDEVSDNTDLAAPLKRLSHAVRNGGNIGAHFDLEKEPNAEIAKMVVSLVHYLIEFLYILPANIEELESALDSFET